MGPLHAMMPGNTLSATSAPSAFQEKQNTRTEPLIDWEVGGVGIGDNSLGFMSHLWRMDYVAGDFIATREGAAPVTVFSRPNVTEIALAFDQNMRPILAFVDDLGTWIRWYDPLASDWGFIQLVGASTPRATMDIKGGALQSDSDVIIAYMKGADLCYRQQRDRFATERVLKVGIGGALISIGKNLGNRLQFKIKPV